MKDKKQWPFDEKPEFGNPKQIAFMHEKKKEQDRIDKFKNGEAKIGELQFVEYVQANCSICDHYGEPSHSKSDSAGYMCDSLR